MEHRVFRYVLAETIPVEDIEAALVLALLAVEGLHGEATTRLDAAHHFDASQMVCVIDAASKVGRDLNRLFVSFLEREFGKGAFLIERVSRSEIALHAGSPA